MISVIVPAYNASQTIRRTLDSIMDQTRPPDEVVLVDDGSTDDTATIARSYDIRVHCVANGGPARARNIGLETATGTLAFFCDSDDAWYPHKVAAHLEAWDSSDEPAFVFDPAQRMRLERRAGISGLGAPGPVRWEQMLDQANWTCGSTASMKRARLLEIGGFREALTFAEDVDVLIRMGHAYGPGHRLALPGTEYCLGPNTFSRQPYDVVQIIQTLKNSMPFLTLEQLNGMAHNVALHNALHSPRGQMLKALRVVGGDIWLDRRVYKFALLRVLHFLGLRPL